MLFENKIKGKFDAIVCGKYFWAALAQGDHVMITIAQALCRPVHYYDDGEPKGASSLYRRKLCAFS